MVKAVVLPLGVILVVGMIIMSIGESLLAAAHAEHSYALILGLTVTLTICAGAFFAAGGFGANPETHH